ncbi:hypothetical protein GH714_037168 [Hevea brasiliensis]|uniref:RNase H type-1 domain-containing protein n=1 Tax=Hevea brasiliensis TaxID=3981 RepID=A0A6A6KMQ6_HEVBR|nr:hypothetical protein GH714_037168 [Hevea brasiliensis]
MYFSQIQTAISQCFWQINFQDFNFQPNAPYIPNIVCDYAWHPPPEGWVKLNVDGSCLSNPGDASAGCLLRDASSNWLLGFSFNIGETSVLAAELIGISFGLQLAWLNGFRRVIVESDCLKAVKLINNEEDILSSFSCFNPRLSKTYEDELALLFIPCLSRTKFLCRFSCKAESWFANSRVSSLGLASMENTELMDFSQIQTAISQCFWQIDFQDFNFQPNAPYIPNIVCDYAWHPPPEGCVKLNVDGSCLGNPDTELMDFSQIQTAISQCLWQIDFQDFNFQPNAPCIPNIVCDYAWHPPPEGWVKLNVDGSCLGNPGDASVGGLLRDFSSNWLLGFGFNIGETSVLAAELIGISFGLQLAWLNGFRRVIVESDCLKAVKLINNEEDIFFHPLAALIQDCRRLMKMNWHCCLSHVYREQNFCADSLAKQSHGLQIQELVVWDSPPWKVLRFLNDDKFGVNFRRY